MIQNFSKKFSFFIAKKREGWYEGDTISKIATRRVVMDKKIKVAVLGATGAVGQVFMWMLADHPWFEPAYLIAGEQRAGRKYGESVHWIIPVEMPGKIRDCMLKKFDIDAMKKEGVKIVFSALPADVAQYDEPMLRDAGFYVFSNAAAMRYEKNVSILIPEVNMEQLPWIEKQGYPQKGFVITNANCATTGLTMALGPLKKWGIKEITVSTYQSISGAGYPGLSSFDINNTCIPFIGKEEEKVNIETRKILSIDPEIYVYTVRVPVLVGHLETVWVKFEQNVEPQDVIDAWAAGKKVPGLPSSPETPVLYRPEDTFPQQKYAFWGTPMGMTVYTGRVRKVNDKIGFVLLVNNIVKGAAGGSVLNAEAFVKHYGLV